MITGSYWSIIEISKTMLYWTGWGATPDWTDRTAGWTGLDQMGGARRSRGFPAQQKKTKIPRILLEVFGT